MEELNIIAMLGGLNRATEHISCAVSTPDLEELKKISTTELKWLKKEYSDVCSDGDIIINEILNDLLANTPIDKMNKKNYEVYYVNHILASHKQCLDGEDPDPYWAD